MRPVLAHSTSSQIDDFLSRPVHGLLIEGPAGSGKATVAKYIAAKILNLEAAKLANYPFFSIIEAADKAITIEQVRQAQQFMRLKTIGPAKLKRVLVIDNAQYLTQEAQNALLKLLEEPPADTVIVLTASPEKRLLSTIYSRVQKLKITPLSKAQAVEIFSNDGFSSSEIERAYNIAGGLVGLMAALLASDQEHTLSLAINEAKKIVSADSFERIALVDKLSKRKSELPELFYALQRIYAATLRQAAKRNDYRQLRRSEHALSLLLMANESLARNTNPKLLLTDLFLNI